MTDWQLLGLEEGADEEALRKAWKTLALKHHPDRNPEDPDAESTFKRIKAAYERLLEGDLGPRPQGMDPDWLDRLLKERGVENLGEAASSSI